MPVQMSCENCQYWELAKATRVNGDVVLAPCHHRHLKSLFSVGGSPVLTSGNFGCLHHFWSPPEIVRGGYHS